MKMIELSFEGAQPPIDGYAPGGFRVAGQFIEGAVLLSARGVQHWSAGPAPAGLDMAAAEAVISAVGDVDVLLLGTGAEIAPLPSGFREALTKSGLRFDVMGAPAACRTYNVLLTEDRRIAAALLPLPAASGA
ncbi:MAG: Mth938-like domain-containing protein [Neomegalonema sp.]|nr:Mth938-like domain-containing protein [Neomegalonema sp.]